MDATVKEESSRVRRSLGSEMESFNLSIEKRTDQIEEESSLNHEKLLEINKNMDSKLSEFEDK